MKKISFLILIAVFITASAAAQITFGSSSSNSSTSASLNISKPSGVSEGDVMIVNIVQRNNGTIAPSLAGWTPISNASVFVCVVSSENYRQRFGAWRSAGFGARNCQASTNIDRSTTL